MVTVSLAFLSAPARAPGGKDTGLGGSVEGVCVCVYMVYEYTWGVCVCGVWVYGI